MALPVDVPLMPVVVDQPGVEPKPVAPPVVPADPQAPPQPVVDPDEQERRGLREKQDQNGWNSLTYEEGIRLRNLERKAGMLPFRREVPIPSHELAARAPPQLREQVLQTGKKVQSLREQARPEAQKFQKAAQ